MKTTKEKILSIIEKIGILTGSRSWGVYHDDSDWDYIVLFEDFRKEMDKKNILFHFDNPYKTYNEPIFIKTDIEVYDCKDNLFRSYKINGEYLFNIIMVWTKEEFKAWETATKWMNFLPVFMIKNKECRVKIFEALKELARNIK